MRSIPHKTVLSLLRTVQQGYVNAALVEGSLVYDSRDEIALMAVSEGYDYVLYVDSDMVFSKDHLMQLLKHDVGICSGLYLRRDGTDENVAYEKVITRRRFPYRAPELIVDKGTTGFGPVAACGFGFCLIKTSVLKTMLKYYKSLFEPFKGVGEDIAFCLRAKRLGYKTFIDRDVKLGHIGEKVYE